MLNARGKRVSEKIRAIQSGMDIKLLEEMLNLEEVLPEHPRREGITGYYAEIDISQHEVIVPNSPRFPDKDGNNEKVGLFDVPIFTLKEWQKKYPKDQRPSLLVNANWFNIWESGVPFFGQKMNIRNTPRSYLIGLSISNGKLVSSHTVCDQHNVKLDTIVFSKHQVYISMLEKLLEVI